MTDKTISDLNPLQQPLLDTDLLELEQSSEEESVKLPLAALTEYIYNNIITNNDINADYLDGQDSSYYLNASNITNGVLSVSNGGTGKNSFVANTFLFCNSTDTIAEKTASEVKTILSLNNVDNTSDINKPISNATQLALNLKSNSDHTHLLATTSIDGFMSSADKIKLNGIPDGGGGITNHAALSGLTNDDHTQYFNSSRLADYTGFDSRYRLSSVNIDWSEIDNIPSTFPPSEHGHTLVTTTEDGFMSSADKIKLDGIPEGGGGGGGGVTDHSSLTGLTNDDHTQYFNSSRLADYTGFDSRYRLSSVNIDWSEIDNIPSTFPPSEHGHTISDITDFSTIIEEAPNDSFSYIRKNEAWTKQTFERQITFDGGGNVIPSDTKAYIRFNSACKIKKVSMFSPISTDALIDIWIDTWENFPPTNVDSITSSSQPQLISSLKYEDSVLTGWDVDISNGDVMVINIDSTTATFLMISIFFEAK